MVLTYPLDENGNEMIPMGQPSQLPARGTSQDDDTSDSESENEVRAGTKNNNETNDEETKLDEETEATVKALQEAE